MSTMLRYTLLGTKFRYKIKDSSCPQGAQRLRWKAKGSYCYNKDKRWRGGGGGAAGGKEGREREREEEKTLHATEVHNIW